MVGDLLTSSKIKPTLQTSVPTVGKITVLDDSPILNFPIGLKQKIVLVNKRLCIGWSGNLQKATDFFDALQFQTQLVDCDARSVEMAIDRAREENDCADLQLIAHIDGTDTVRRVYRNAAVFTSKSLGEYVCIGSGTDQAEAVLRDVESNLTIQRNGPAIEGLRIALLFAGTLHAREVGGMATIADAFGGGSEICYFTAEGVQKLDKVAFAHVEFERANGKTMFAPISFSCQYYVDEDLIIHVARLQSAVPAPPDASNSNLHVDAYVIIPPHKKAGAIRIEPILQSLHFDYQVLCTCFISKVTNDAFVDVQSTDAGGWLQLQKTENSGYDFQIHEESLRRFGEKLNE